MNTIYIDEAWRGPLAWPVYVGAVYERDPDRVASDFSGYGDSKQLTEKQRDLSYQKILSDSNFVVATSSSSASVIDRYGIIIAQQKAICKALWKIVLEIKGYAMWTKGHAKIMSLQRYSVKSLKKLLVGLDELPVIHLDGNHKFWLDTLLGLKVITTIKWDSTVPQISMASILAKVERDRYMVRQAKRYPVYGFERHKGYGTQFHRDSISKYGPCSLHRKSFIHSFV